MLKLLIANLYNRYLCMKSNFAIVLKTNKCEFKQLKSVYYDSIEIQRELTMMRPRNRTTKRTIIMAKLKSLLVKAQNRVNMLLLCLIIDRMIPVTNSTEWQHKICRKSVTFSKSRSAEVSKTFRLTGNHSKA